MSLPSSPELSDPPAFGPHGARPPLESDEHVVERFLLTAAPRDTPPSPALLHLLNGPIAAGSPFADACRWAWTQVPPPGRPEPVPPRPGPPGGPASDPAPGDLRRRQARLGALGIGAGLSLAAAGAIVLPAVAAAAAFGYRWHKRQERSDAGPVVATSSCCSLQRLRHGQRWVRDPEIHALPPGSSSQYSRTTTVGLSRSTASELGGTLGLERNLQIIKLNAELSGTLKRELSITDEQQESFTVSIENDRADVDRHYAMWRIEHRIVVDELAVDGHVLWWQPKVEAVFYRSGAIRYTMAQIRRRDG